METFPRGQHLRPVGSYIEAPDGYNGDMHSGELLFDDMGQFWARGINSRGNPFLFTVSDRWAAVHCLTIGNAPTVEARP
jgi:hypothetical protein